MVQIRLRPILAKLLISKVYDPYPNETSRYLEEEIKEGRWDKVPPIWLTPNFIVPGMFTSKFGGGLTALLSLPFKPFFPSDSEDNNFYDNDHISNVLQVFRPFIIYDGHHRFTTALENNLSISAYIRYTPGNPPFTGNHPWEGSWY